MIGVSISIFPTQCLSSVHNLNSVQYFKAFQGKNGVSLIFIFPDNKNFRMKIILEDLSISELISAHQMTDRFVTDENILTIFIQS